MIVGDNQISFGLQGSLGVIKEGCTHFLWTPLDCPVHCGGLCVGRGRKEEGSKDLSVVFFQLALTGETAFEIIGSYLENSEFYFQIFHFNFQIRMSAQARQISLLILDVYQLVGGLARLHNLATIFKFSVHPNDDTSGFDFYLI